MDDKLVTLAILTFEKAQIVKTILEGEDVEVSIENVNQIQPVISAGVRLRIRESDLPKAIRIIEDLNLADIENIENKHILDGDGAIGETLEDSSINADDKSEKGGNKVAKVILVPVDFSDYSHKACVWAIRLAKDMHYEVRLVNAVYSPFYIANTYAPDAGIGAADGMLVQKSSNLHSEAKKEMIQLVDKLTQEMSNGTLPQVKLKSMVVQGIPEDMIIQLSKTLNAQLIVMGSRGNTNRNFEVIGSVTAEVIDRCKEPVLAIPEDVEVNSFEEVKNIGFATSFSQKDLIYFDLFMETISRYKMNIHLFNISTSNDEWDEIRMNGVKEYFKKQYPEQKIYYHVLESGDRLKAIQKLLDQEAIKMVALPIARKSLWIRLFNPSLAQKMLFSTKIPLLVYNPR